MNDSLNVFADMPSMLSGQDLISTRAGSFVCQRIHVILKAQ